MIDTLCSMTSDNTVDLLIALLRFVEDECVP